MLKRNAFLWTHYFGAPSRCFFGSEQLFCRIRLQPEKRFWPQITVASSGERYRSEEMEEGRGGNEASELVSAHLISDSRNELLVHNSGSTTAALYTFMESNGKNRKHSKKKVISLTSHPFSRFLANLLDGWRFSIVSAEVQPQLGCPRGTSENPLMCRNVKYFESNRSLFIFFPQIDEKNLLNYYVALK